MACFQTLSVKTLLTFFIQPNNPKNPPFKQERKQENDLNLNLKHKYEYGKRREVHHHSGRTSLRKETDGGTGRAHKPRCTGQVKSDSSRFPHSATLHRSVVAVWAITYNLHPKGPQHFSKSNYWRKKIYNRPGRATKGRRHGARNLFLSKSKSEQWVHLQNGFRVKVS